MQAGTHLFNLWILCSLHARHWAQSSARWLNALKCMWGRTGVSLQPAPRNASSGVPSRGQVLDLYLPV